MWLGTCSLSMWGGSRQTRGIFDDSLVLNVSRLRVASSTHPTQIYYTSRTHTQLRQLTSELLKTTFAAPPAVDTVEIASDEVNASTSTRDGQPAVAIPRSNRPTSRRIEVTVDPSSPPPPPPPGSPIRTVPLASRRQLCINPSVRGIGARFGDERMNEACLELQKAGAFCWRAVSLLVLVRKRG
jgi:predicted component of type VI protein secretion system